MRFHCLPLMDTAFQRFLPRYKLCSHRNEPHGYRIGTPSLADSTSPNYQPLHHPHPHHPTKGTITSPLGFSIQPSPFQTTNMLTFGQQRMIYSCEQITTSFNPSRRRDLQFRHLVCMSLSLNDISHQHHRQSSSICSSRPVAGHYCQIV
jgi:hypothetical protein